MRGGLGVSRGQRGIGRGERQYARGEVGGSGMWQMWQKNSGGGGGYAVDSVCGKHASGRSGCPSRGGEGYTERSSQKKAGATRAFSTQGVRPTTTAQPPARLRPTLPRARSGRQLPTGVGRPSAALRPSRPALAAPHRVPLLLLQGARPGGPHSTADLQRRRPAPRARAETRHPCCQRCPTPRTATPTAQCPSPQH